MYNYLKHIIQLWLGNWVNHMSKMNGAIGTNNRLYNSGKKKQVVHTFRSQELWKCIGCILSEVTYRNKGHKLGGGIQNILVRRHKLNYTEMFVETHI